MKFVSIGKNRQMIEVPDTWIEAEAMITKAMLHHGGRGGNTAQRAVASAVVYGMFGEKWMAADPTQALMYLVRRVCERKGAGLEK
jgi:hypothetical protein